MAKYIKCDGCGKPILFGSEVYQFDNFCGLYCSAECFADSYAICRELDENLADDCHHETYDDEERKKELRKSIREFEMKLGLMISELEELEDASM